MAFAIKAKVENPRAETFTFTAQKTMYGGKHIAWGDMVFVFAGENEGGQGLVARGVVISSEPIAKTPRPRTPDALRQRFDPPHRSGHETVGPR